MRTIETEKESLKPLVEYTKELGEFELLNGFILNEDYL